MSHTEQMREAFERHMSDGGKFPKAVERSGDGYRLLQTQNAWDAWKACAAAIIAKTTTENTPKGMLSTTCPWCESGFAFEAPALTTPAAEVPEAMGDAEINSLRYLLDVDDYDPNMMKFASAILRHRDAQWQSTRLRGGVPDIKHVCMQVAENPEVEDALSHYVNDDSDTLTIAWLVEVILKHALEAAPQAPAAALDAGGVRDAERYMGLTEAHDAIDAAMNGGSHG